MGYKTSKAPKPKKLNYIQPPSVIHLMTKDVIVKRPSMTPTHERGERQNIELFSPNSQKRLLVLARNSGHFIKSQICLTYHFAMPETGEEVKKQLNQFLTEMRKEYKSIHYLWVLEFQERGVPHFHVFTSVCPSNTKFRDWCAITWNRILGESPQHLAFQGHPKNFIPWFMASGRYLVKEYLAKAAQKTVPEAYHSVGRFWGNSRSMKPVEILIEPDQEIPEKIFYKILRIITKKREKEMKKWVKKNYRKYCISYSLPNCSAAFIALVDYYCGFIPQEGGLKIVH